MQLDLKSRRGISSVDVVSLVEEVCGIVVRMSEGLLALQGTASGEAEWSEEIVVGDVRGRRRDRTVRGFGSKAARRALDRVSAEASPSISIARSATVGSDVGRAHVHVHLIGLEGSWSLGLNRLYDLSVVEGGGVRLRLGVDGSPVIRLEETPGVVVEAVWDLARLAAARFGPVGGSGGFWAESLLVYPAYRQSTSPHGVDSYNWLVALPADVVAGLGGPDAVVATVPAARTAVVDSGEGVTVLCMLTPEPSVLPEEQRRALRSYLEPWLPERTGSRGWPGEVVPLTVQGWLLEEDLDWPGRNPREYPMRGEPFFREPVRRSGG